MPQRILAAARAALVLRKAELGEYGFVSETGDVLLDAVLRPEVVRVLAALVAPAVLRLAKVTRPARFLRALAAAWRRARAADETARSACWPRATTPVQGRRRRHQQRIEESSSSQREPR